MKLLFSIFLGLVVFFPIGYLIGLLIGMPVLLGFICFMTPVLELGLNPKI